jgi:hypothetical protein
MYRIKSKWIGTVLKYSMKTKLDVKGAYTKADWNKNGFKDSILEKI